MTDKWKFGGMEFEIREEEKPFVSSPGEFCLFPESITDALAYYSAKLPPMPADLSKAREKAIREYNEKMREKQAQNLREMLRKREPIPLSLIAKCGLSSTEISLLFSRHNYIQGPDPLPRFFIPAEWTDEDWDDE